MIITDEELFDFFKSKVECAIAQIKSKGWRISTSPYKVMRSRNLDVWVPITVGYMHPLGFFLEGQKLLHDRSAPKAISRKLDCKLEFIEAFNEGLQGKPGYPKGLVLRKFFMYGRKVRIVHAKKKLKKK
jgi:hypothetical protein